MVVRVQVHLLQRLRRLPLLRSGPHTDTLPRASHRNPPRLPTRSLLLPHRRPRNRQRHCWCRWVSLLVCDDLITVGGCSCYTVTALGGGAGENTAAPLEPAAPAGVAVSAPPATVNPWPAAAAAPAATAVATPAAKGTPPPSAVAAPSATTPENAPRDPQAYRATGVEHSQHPSPPRRRRWRSSDSPPVPCSVPAHERCTSVPKTDIRGELRVPRGDQIS